MNEHLSPETDIKIQAFIEHAPIYRGVFFKEISSGSMNSVYDIPSLNQIIHITPFEIIDTGQFSHIIEPHAITDKGSLVARTMAELSIPRDTNIKTANILDYGKFTEKGHDYTYWLESKLQGVQLSSDPDGLAIQEYRALTKWTAALQVENTDPALQKSLVDYYLNRLDGFITFYNSQDGLVVEDINSILESYRDAVLHSVDKNEKTSFVHGDLNSSNILVSKDGADNVQLSVIDFEKSIYYGDPLVDPMKLYIMKHDYITPDAAYSYIPPLLSRVSRAELLADFLNSRYSENYGIDSKILLDNRYVRDYLIHLDTILSVLAYRILNKNSKINNEAFLQSYLTQFYIESKESGSLHEQ